MGAFKGNQQWKKMWIVSNGDGDNTGTGSSEIVSASDINGYIDVYIYRKRGGKYQVEV